MQKWNPSTASAASPRRPTTSVMRVSASSGGVGVTRVPRERRAGRPRPAPLGGRSLLSTKRPRDAFRRRPAGDASGAGGSGTLGSMAAQGPLDAPGSGAPAPDDFQKRY